jgi:glyoxylase-like metal-dependent hydrolase (beta-lactamase superfamily II)
MAIHRRSLLGSSGASALALLLGHLPAQAQIVTTEHRRLAFAASRGSLSTFDSGETGFFTRTYFYDTGQEAVAFDAQFTPALAEAAIADFRTHSDSPLRALVLTHPNPDKFNGASAFQADGATVIASEATTNAMPDVHAYKQAYFVSTGMFTEETYPAQAHVDESFSDTLTLHLGEGQTVELTQLGQPGVSSTQTVAYLSELNALIVGDLVHHKMHAWLEGGIIDGQATPAIEGWIADLRELETRYGALEPTVYGGRGEPAPLSEAVTAQIAYLTRADQIVSNYVAGLGDRATALDGAEASEHYAAIQREMERAYPDYAFPDMIGFSVYGLVNARR